MSLSIRSRPALYVLLAALLLLPALAAAQDYGLRKAEIAIEGMT